MNKCFLAALMIISVPAFGQTFEEVGPQPNENGSTYTISGVIFNEESGGTYVPHFRCYNNTIGNCDILPSMTVDGVNIMTRFNGKQPLINPGSSISDSLGTASTNNPTNYNALTGLLGLANALNDANAKQNALAQQHNDLSKKFNDLVNNLEQQGIQAP